MATRVRAPTLQTQAAALASGRDPDQASKLNTIDYTGLPSVSSILQGIVDQYRLAAYYTPTRETFDFTGRMISAYWTQAHGQGAKQGTIILDNSDGRVASYAARPGLIAMLSTAGPDRVFNERERFIVQQSDVGDLRQGIVTWMVYDSLIFLQNAIGSWSYTPDRGHRHGWTASEIIIDICTALGVPYSVVKTDYRIPYFQAKQLSAYDVICKALSIDFRHSGKFFWIDSVKGVITVSRVHSADKEPTASRLTTGGAPAVRNLTASQLPVVDVDMNVTTADFIRTLPSNMYTSITPVGADPLTSNGKPGKRYRTYSPAQTGEEASVQASVNGRQLIPSRGKVAPPVASILFGALDYDAHTDKIGTVHDPGWTHSAMQALANILSKVGKQVTATVPLNIMVSVGNRMLVRLRFADGVIFKKELFVSQITKQIDQNGPVMQLTFSWRYIETVDKEQTSDVTTRPPPKIPSSGPGGADQAAAGHTSTAKGTSAGSFIATAYGPPWNAMQGYGTTATGIKLPSTPGPQAGRYIVAADPTVLPMHSQIKVNPNPFGNPNIVFRVEDTGGAIKGSHIDFLVMAGRAAQNNWGTQPVSVSIIKRG